MPPGDTFLKLIHLPHCHFKLHGSISFRDIQPDPPKPGVPHQFPMHTSSEIFLYIAAVVVNIYLDAPCEIPTSITFGHRHWSQNFVFGLVAIGTPWGQKFIFTVSVQICLGCTVWPQSTFVTNQRCHIS